MLVLTSVMVTVAPGMARFDESLTLPTSDPLTACAYRAAGASAVTMRGTTKRRIPILLLIETQVEQRGVKCHTSSMTSTRSDGILPVGWQRRRRFGSGDDVVDDRSRDVRQPEVAAAISIGKPGVVDAEQIKDGRVQVVHVHRLVDRLEAEV